jgi:hypothetical protein
MFCTCFSLCKKYFKKWKKFQGKFRTKKPSQIFEPQVVGNNTQPLHELTNMVRRGNKKPNGKVFVIHLPSIPHDMLISSRRTRMWDYVTHNPPAHHPFKICYYGSVVDKPQQTYQGSTLVTYIMTPITPSLH